MEKFNVSRLVGAPPGYVGYEEGGQLTEKVRRKPYSVVLLDEIEKAHPDIYNILLQVLDEGILTDSLGRRVDFKNTILIMTSNIGTKDIKQIGNFGFGNVEAKDKYDKMKSHIEETVRKVFSPEFLNRIDDLITFKQLSKQDIVKIIDISTRQLLKRMSALGISFEFTDSAKEFLSEKGYDPLYGARPLRRAVQKYIEDPISEEILKGTFKEGARIRVKHKENADELYFADAAEEDKKVEEPHDALNN
jgi:ATP-dependent Clp protease ATP-binding subunit ClpC